MQITEIVQQIKKHGADKASAVPDQDDKYKIVISTAHGQVTLKRGLSRAMAEDVIRQATNRVILG